MPKIRKYTKYEPEPLDEEKFQELLHILHQVIYSGNWSATARALGVSTPTAIRWVNNPPKQPGWLFMLRQVIREITSQLKYSPHKKDQRIRLKALNRLAELGHIVVSNVESDYEILQSVKRVLATLNEAPGQTLSLTELHRSTGYSKATIRSIAMRLQLITETSGFGSKKQTHYSIPRTEDL